MSYVFEISINHKKIANETKVQTEIINIANRYNCQDYYNRYEFSGKNRTIKYYNNIFTITFLENIKNVCNFIREIKLHKGIYIESIGFDNVVYNLIYASKKYLNIMEKQQVRDYIKKKHSGEIYQKNTEILNLLNKN
jgi:hypothetical protein